MSEDVGGEGSGGDGANVMPFRGASAAGPRLVPQQPGDAGSKTPRLVSVSRCGSLMVVRYMLEGREQMQAVPAERISHVQSAETTTDSGEAFISTALWIGHTSPATTPPYAVLVDPEVFLRAALQLGFLGEGEMTIAAEEIGKA